MSSAVHFGAGNIGRGFLGQLLYEGGYQTTFIDANASLVSQLQMRSAYPLRLVDSETRLDLTIQHIEALDIRVVPESAVQAVAAADLVSTAVGVAILPHIAQTLAEGINQRALRKAPPLNILLCENQWHVGTWMRDLLEPSISPQAHGYFTEQVGLVETVIGRMVPLPSEAVKAEDPLLIIAEPFKELPVARASLRGPAPNLPGLLATDDFEAYEARKLFLHNAGHAALAYLGHQRGYKLLWECADDPEISALCRQALSESAQALVALYQFDARVLQEFIDDLMRRFQNRALGDTVARVAADPLRKLRPSDRLVGAANLCLAQGISPNALAAVIAAALRYAGGETEILESVCHILPGTPLDTMVRTALASRETRHL